MSDAFNQLVPEARAFLNDLAGDNTRDWWKTNKPRYETTLKLPSLLLLHIIADRLRRMTGHDVTPKLFRPHRDVRFSKDETPYHTHLHMMWSVRTGGRQEPALFFAVAPDYVRAGGGAMTFDKEVLMKWRNLVDRDDPRVSKVFWRSAKGQFLCRRTRAKACACALCKGPFERVLVAPQEAGGVG